MKCCVRRSLPNTTTVLHTLRKKGDFHVCFSLTQERRYWRTANLLRLRLVPHRNEIQRNKALHLTRAKNVVVRSNLNSHILSTRTGTVSALSGRHPFRDSYVTLSRRLIIHQLPFLFTATILDLSEEILLEVATYLSSEFKNHDLYNNAECFAQ